MTTTLSSHPAHARRRKLADLDGALVLLLIIVGLVAALMLCSTGCTPTPVGHPAPTAQTAPSPTGGRR